METFSCRSIRSRAALLVLLAIVPVTLIAADRSSPEALIQSGDAYVRQAGSRWLFGTGKVEKVITLKDGHVYFTGFRNQAGHRDYIQGPSEAFRFGLNGKIVTGQNTHWDLDGVRTELRGQGEIYCSLLFRNDVVRVSQNYLIYPGESVIEEWLTIKNISSRDVALEDPSFLNLHVMQKEVPQIDFSYMTGGSCFWGSWILKTSALTPTYARKFASTDPFECLPGQLCPENGGTGISKHGGMGSSAYAPIFVLLNRTTKDGAFVGWDYLGQWSAQVGNYNGEPVNLTLKVLGYKKTLAPGLSVETPRAFTGVFHGDLDEMGNELKDYQYRYKWDYTRDAYFPAVRMLGYWWSGATDWDPKHRRTDLDAISMNRKALRIGDLMRSLGGDVFWRDAGWWDVEGTWNGEDFAEAGRYLAKNGIPQTIYTVVYDAEQGSAVANEHPDWLIYKSPNRFNLDQSKPEVTDWELNLLENQVRKWGDYEWRKDDNVLHDVNGDTTPLLAQDQNFRKLVKNFLDRNPGSAFHGCAGGGNDITYEMVRMSVVWQISDGCEGRYRDYYASYLFPPDKMESQPDNWDPGRYDQASWRPQLWWSPSFTGDTHDPDKVAAIRQLVDIYHYLAKQGVVGRWVKVYHPAVEGDSPEWYLERLSSDGQRGIIIPSHSAQTPSTIRKADRSGSPFGEWDNGSVKGPVTIYPKGLTPGTTYQVSFHESKGITSRSGEDLMTHGVVLQDPQAGDLIYLNLSLHPGSDGDHTPPSAPRQVAQRLGTNVGYSGVELTWLPATDDNWISYYEIFRNGGAIDRVAKGTYYFDHSLGSDPSARYEVRAVDGSGNASDKALSEGASGVASVIVDDASESLQYSGTGWKHEQGVPDIYNGTQSKTQQNGDSVEYEFEGNQVAWYGTLGDSMGQADVYIDGVLDRSVDCFDADELRNVAVYVRSFKEIGKHRIKITARGQRQWRSFDNWIVIDGLKVGKETGTVIEDLPGRDIAYAGSGWAHGDGWDAAEGKSISWTKQPGDSAEYKFHGDSITWIGKLCPTCGIANVYIDGTLDADIDTYEPDYHPFRPDVQGGWQVPVYVKSWAASGDHTIRIVVSKDDDLVSRGHTVYLDAFRVTGQQ